jgi:glycosyltransferase involved in cell wall biosynthesis
MLYSSDVAGILAARLICRTRIVAHVVGNNFLVTEERGMRRFRMQCLSLLYRLIYRGADQVIAVSQAVRNDLVRRRGMRVPPAKIAVIPHSVWEADLHYSAEHLAQAKQRLAIPDGTVLCVTIGNLFPIKGHHYLLQGVRRLLGVAPPVTCVVIGEGPQRPMLEREAARLGLNGHVIFAGALEGPVRNAMVHLSRVVVLPSLSEGLPVTILEAMALAKPIVATDVGGNREAVEDGVTGLLVPPRDPEALAAAVRRVVADEALATRMGQAGRRRFDEYFTPDRMFRQFEAVYAEGS